MSNRTLYSSQHSTVSRFCPTDFAADADLAKPGWQYADKVFFDTSYWPETRFPEARTRVASLWSETYVYFAFWSRYTQLFTYVGEDPNVERVGLWDRDVVEVFVNPFPERANVYWEFEVAPNNQWVDLAINLDEQPFYDAGWNSNFEHAVRTVEREKVWLCEMRIPLHAFGISRIEPGAEWRLNYYRCDGPGDDTERRFLAWSPTLERSFHVPRRFGRLRFER